jgi:hypothetical protein
VWGEDEPTLREAGEVKTRNVCFAVGSNEASVQDLFYVLTNRRQRHSSR